MQSPMVTINPTLIPTDLEHSSAVRGGYSDLKVLSSAAGFYIGTLYEEFDAGGKCVWQEPGSRDSGYFRTADDAAKELRQIEGGDLSDVRFHP